ncbi:MAG: bifunctional [glutamate--ammonia ligase]-adenylyl-L-tyrosine phosphorylase/[glutamate--ammonia-ligase] adenylyltransferase [Candidatus Binataceae bacterium]
MDEAAEFAPGLHTLAARLAQCLEPSLAGVALRAVRERAPDERLALAFMLKLAEQSPAEFVAAMRDPQSAGDLAFCLGASEFVATALSAMPRWPEFFHSARTSPPDDLLEAIAAGIAREDAEVILAELNHRAFAHIVIADLLGGLDVTATMSAMARLADESIRMALAAARRRLGARAADAGDFCVMALGKLGAEELNLSSDIDLMYLSGSGDHKRQAAAIRLGEHVTEILTARCFRVDLRLRPGGRNSPLVVSLEGALSFYQSLGQTWERAALLRARPVAGSLELGRSLLGELRRFIYRSYLDFDTLRQLRVMKHRIEQELRPPDRVARNLKLGYGGIRELEFIVQALTLIYGGRDPRLRIAHTIGALERLSTHGYLAPERAERLKRAYLFMRNVEHKLQAAAALQTHTLPNDDAGFAVLAARLGFGKHGAAVARLRDELRGHRELVASQFREMLAGGEERGRTVVSAAAETAWRAARDPEGAAPALNALGFANAAESAGHLELLARGPAHAPTSPRRAELLDRLAPLLLDEIRTLADPDLALMNLAAFIAAIGARTSFLALLEEHPATRRVLLRLFASSSYLSTIFIHHPDMLDTLVRSDLARLRRLPEELAHELGGLVAAGADFERRLDIIRAFRHQEFLRIAIADLAGDLEHGEVRAELTQLAETILREALRLARAEIETRRVVPRELKLCAVAMGRLGAAEMSYNSDLDLIFVYQIADEVAAAGHEMAARIAQKVIAILETRTREGYVYKLDVRLRPSGNAGPLVTSLAGFRDYHRQSSAVWERQALVRARVIAGDEGLAEEVEEARRQFVFGRALEPDEVGEIAAMRSRMEHEIGVENQHRLNLKQGPGGLVDVEFLTQMMALRHGCKYEGLRQRSTTALLAASGEAGLISPADVGELQADYRFLSRLENRLRIETDRAAWALPTDPHELTPLARRMGYDGNDAAARLLAEVEARRARIRALYDRYFAREQKAPA